MVSRPVRLGPVVLVGCVVARWADWLLLARWRLAEWVDFGLGVRLLGWVG